MKRFIALSLVCTMLLTACSASDNDTDGTDTTATESDSFDFSEGITDNGYFADIKALDYVKLCAHKGIDVPAEDHTITDTAVESYIDSILSDYSTKTTVKDRAVEDGDTVNIDYVGSIDGVEFSGGTTNGTGTDVTIGVTSFIDDFLEQLIGHKPGETFNVEVTFPDTYIQNTSLQGKDAVFVTTINYITEYVNPELTDGFVKENLTEEYGWTTVDEMRADVKSTLTASRVRDYVRTYLVDNSEITIPDSVYSIQKNSMLSYYKTYAQNYGVEFTTFLINYIGVSTEDELIEKHKEEIEKSCKMYLVAQAISEQENIISTKEDVIQYLKDSISGFDEAYYDSYAEQLGIGYLMQASMNQVIYKFVADAANLK